jgi:hypothetical protein
MTTQQREQTAADIAGILARGYDLHIEAHGPDGSRAVRTEDGHSYEVTQTADGATSYVERDGVRFAVTVTPLADDGTIREGTKVRLIDPPGTKVPYGTIGIADEEPGDSGLFWVRFPQGRMHTRVSEVEIVKQGERS